MATYKKERDKFREAAFKDAYGINSRISVVQVLDDNGDWIQCDVGFDNKYVLREIFKPGNDNSTDYVILIHDKNNIVFDSYIDSELYLVDEMRK